MTSAPPDRRRFLTRRRFAFLGMAGSALAAIALWFFRGRLLQLGPIARALGRELDRDSPTGRLTQAEAATLVAFGEVLIPTMFSGPAAFTTPPPDSRAEAPSHVLEQALGDLAGQVPGYLSEFQAAARFLNEKAGARSGSPFASTALESRRALVETQFRGYVGRSRRRAFFFLTSDGRRTAGTWEFVARPMLAAFYRSPYGWRVVGYAKRPGECSNLVDYQRPVS